MSDQKSNCCGAVMNLLQDGNYFCLGCHRHCEPCDPKPVCEHDHEISWKCQGISIDKTTEPYQPTCPFCKPEPIVLETGGVGTLKLSNPDSKEETPGLKFNIDHEPKPEQTVEKIMGDDALQGEKSASARSLSRFSDGKEAEPMPEQTRENIKTPEEIAKEIVNSISIFRAVYPKDIIDAKYHKLDESENLTNWIAEAISAERNANLEKIRELEKRVESNRLYGYRDGKKEMEDVVKKLENELYRIRCVAERLRDSDDENEISLEENIAGKYMIKVLDGENFS